MGQSPSTAIPSPEPYRRQLSFSSDDDYSTAGGPHDYTSDIPDECLAMIFHLLTSVDRKRCSVVSKRWLRVDGESRYRLSLQAKGELINRVPSIFTRFHSVTKLALRCDRRSTSINDDALILISLWCRNLTRLKLRGCREITEAGMVGLANNCKNLKKLSCGSCIFGAKGVYALIEHCNSLEELSIIRLRGVDDDISTGIVDNGVVSVPSSLKSICLKELVNGRSFEPLIIGAKKLRSLKLIRCLGDWDMMLEDMGKLNPGLVEIHLEKVQVSDLGLRGISKCLKLETLHVVKTPECSDLGIIDVAEKCTMLKKLHIDGWRTNRIGNDALIAVARNCPNLLELVLIAMFPTGLGLEAVVSNCRNLERLALCGIGTVGDAEIEYIATKSLALKKICIKGCPVSNSGIVAFGFGCPNLVKLKVRKCSKVSREVVEWLRKKRGPFGFNFDFSEVESEALDGSGSDGGGVEESTTVFPHPIVAQVTTLADDTAASSSNNNNNRFSMLRTKFGFLASWNVVPCAFRRWSNNDNISGDSF
ncbi:hypothetical protein TanjilG_12666 [Lupinus angustifolius]|uniref:F-box protein SKIP2-like protein n=1 Tax=Lupinus angustifolius TaxID=3871 RepID=A0A3S5X629_LUPAN|nr:PREDICTED: F-box protein SKIP2-like [Lupinus angustifolius]AYQ93030.1 F-box protein SKIP2-like protein [Lupinus angustifolius]OIV97909.1 hypothetical protein TanjilG_12666 [Lupinus angustifolius]